jgi:hypothetical protein
MISCRSALVVNGRACLGNRQPDVGGKGGMNSAEIHKSPPILLTCQRYEVWEEKGESRNAGTLIISFGRFVPVAINAHSKLTAHRCTSTVTVVAWVGFRCRDSD